MKEKFLILIAGLLIILSTTASSCRQSILYENENANAASVNTTSNNGTYSVIGQPTINANFIDQLLCNYGSPARGTGDDLYSGEVQYNIDPTFALAFFWHESNFGTKGEARYSKSLGNLRCIDEELSCTDGYAWFASWQDGYTQWYRLISGGLYIGCGRTTINTIIPRYAPAADNNNEYAYISNLKQLIDWWRAGNNSIP